MENRVVYSVLADDEKVSIGFLDVLTDSTSGLTISKDGQVKTSFSQKDHPHANADILIESSFPVEKLSRLFATISGVQMLKVEFPDTELSFNYISGAEPVCIVSGGEGEEIHRGFDATESIFVVIDRLCTEEMDELERLHRHPEEVKITAVVADEHGNNTVFKLNRDKKFNWSVAVSRGEDEGLREEHEPGTLKAEKEAHRILESLLESISLQYLTFYPSGKPEVVQPKQEKKKKRPRTGPGR